MIPVGKPLLKLQAEISPTTPVPSEETASSEEAPPSEKNPPDKTPTPEGGFSSEESAAQERLLRSLPLRRALPLHSKPVPVSNVPDSKMRDLTPMCAGSRIFSRRKNIGLKAEFSRTGPRHAA